MNRATLEMHCTIIISLTTINPLITPFIFPLHRKVAQSVGDIIVQLDVFVEQQESDEAQSLQAPDGINLNSHLDVFYAILRQVSFSPLVILLSLPLLLPLSLSHAAYAYALSIRYVCTHTLQFPLCV